MTTMLLHVFFYMGFELNVEQWIVFAVRIS